MHAASPYFAIVIVSIKGMGLTTPAHDTAQHPTRARRLARNAKPKHAPDRPGDRLQDEHEEEEGESRETERDGGGVEGGVIHHLVKRFGKAHRGEVCLVVLLLLQ